jgi:nitroreductase
VIPARAEDAEQFNCVQRPLAYQCEQFTSLPALVVVCYEPASFWARLRGQPRRAAYLRVLGALDRVRVLCKLRRWALRASAASAYPAVENLLLAARAHGLGAKLTTWNSAFEGDCKRVLGIPRRCDSRKRRNPPKWYIETNLVNQMGLTCEMAPVVRI